MISVTKWNYWPSTLAITYVAITITSVTSPNNMLLTSCYLVTFKVKSSFKNYDVMFDWTQMAYKRVVKAVLKLINKWS